MTFIRAGFENVELIMFETINGKKTTVKKEIPRDKKPYDTTMNNFVLLGHDLEMEADRVKAKKAYDQLWENWKLKGLNLNSVFTQSIKKLSGDDKPV